MLNMSICNPLLQYIHGTGLFHVNYVTEILIQMHYRHPVQHFIGFTCVAEKQIRWTEPKLSSGLGPDIPDDNIPFRMIGTRKYDESTKALKV